MFMRLGYSYVEIGASASIGMDMRLWILATPIDGTLIDVSLVAQVRELRKTETVACGPGVSPGGDARTLHEQVHRVSTKARGFAG